MVSPNNDSESFKFNDDRKSSKAKGTASKKRNWDQFQQFHANQQSDGYSDKENQLNGSSN